MAGLALRRISHQFDGVAVLNDVSLEVGAGELVCLLGPSGCGKTTLLRIAAGLEPLQQGEIEIAGQCVASGGEPHQLPPEKRGVGLMFQDYALFPHLNVLDNVQFGIRKRDWSRLSWASQALRDVELADYAERFPHTLSGGQQQRIALLRALAPSPRVLLLDEPFSGLDENLRKQVRGEALKILDEVQIAALMVTHDPEEAMFLADRIAVMAKGTIVQAAAPVEVYRHPAAPFVARMMGLTNEYSAVAQGGQAWTPLGPVPAPDLADGEPVLVLVRAEAMRLTAAGEDRASAADSGALRVSGLIQRARPLGARTHLELRVGLPGNDCPISNLQAEIPGVQPLEPGREITLDIDPSLVHVFSAAAH